MAAIYYSPMLQRPARRVFWLGGAAIVLVPLAYSIARAYYGYTRYGPAAVSAWSLPWLGAAGGLFLAWMALLFFLSRRAGYGVLLYQNGLRLGRIESSNGRASARLPSLLPWEQLSGIAVEMVAASAETQPHHRMTLYLKNGRKIRLAEARSRWDPLAGSLGPARIENLPELITRIKAHLYPRLLPSLRAGLLAGHPLPFGPVILHTAGLELKGAGRDPLPWGQIQRVTVRSGNLVVELKNHPKRLLSMRYPVSTIPNLELLFKLIEAYSC